MLKEANVKVEVFVAEAIVERRLYVVDFKGIRFFYCIEYIFV